MKRFSRLFIPLAYLPALFWSGCQSGPGPKEVATNFLQAVLKSNYTQAKQYATKDSEPLLNALASLTGSLPSAERDKIEHSRITIRDVQMKGDLAMVTYVNSAEDKSETLNLKKENGQWKVAFTKDYVLPELDSDTGDSATNIMLQDTTLKPGNQDSSR
ncbi:MAG TPA: hypothetical protein VMV20_02455 [Chitinophagaceae bacterium]|nr:hypothetical protein [Chitinophagaceae bacterium]